VAGRRSITRGASGFSRWFAKTIGLPAEAASLLENDKQRTGRDSTPSAGRSCARLGGGSTFPVPKTGEAITGNTWQPRPFRGDEP